MITHCTDQLPPSERARARAQMEKSMSAHPAGTGDSMMADASMMGHG
jgi:hypothetical protein